MNCGEALERISAALDGELSPAERNELDAHLADCPACAALFEELAGHSRLLRELDCEVPAGLTDRILSQLPDQRPAPAKRSRVLHWRRWGALAACLALVLWAGLTVPDWKTLPADEQTSNAESAYLFTQAAPQEAADEEPSVNRSVPRDEPMGYALDDFPEPYPSDAGGQDGPAEKSAAPAPEHFAASSAAPAIENVRYLRVGWTEDAAPAARLLTSLEEQSEFLDPYDLDASAEVPGADSYETGAVIAVILTESSGSISHTVEEILSCDGGYEIVIRRQVPEIGTDDMAAWLILIEVDGSITPDDTLTVTLSD